VKYLEGRQRLPKGTKTVEWTATLPVESYLYLAELCRIHKQDLPIVLHNLIEEYREKFHTER
jgi:hypothetical protein